MSFMGEALGELMMEIAPASVKILAGSFVFLLFWLGSILARKALRRMHESADPSKKDVIHLIGQSTRIGVLVFGAVTGLATMGINVAALVAGLGLTGFALGFALRDVLSNLLAGAMIIIYRPLQRQDRIVVAGFEGTVVEIDLRYTTLQGEQKRFLIPNSTLFTNTITLFEDKTPSPP
jgi:small conductance mechanosensitive channel